MNSTDKCFSKLKWTPEVQILITQEESFLRSLRETKSLQSWKKIATLMNEAFSDKNRSGKQCRERYMNYVRFGEETPKINRWTPKEDELLFRKYMEIGAKWVQIGKEMPGRSENCLKNRFYGTFRKIIRKLNKRMREKKMKQKNSIKTELLIKILQYETSFFIENEREFDETREFLKGLKNSLIKMAIEPDEESLSEDIEELLKKISRFGAMVKESRALKQNNLTLKNNEIQNPETEVHHYHYTEEKSSQEDSENKENPNYSLHNEVKPKIIKNFILHSNPSEIQNGKNDGLSEKELNNINVGKENLQELI